MKKSGNKHNKLSGKEWWATLTIAEQQEYIHKRERSRKRQRRNMVGKREVFPSGHVKIWLSNDSFAVYKPSMLDDNGNPKI